MYFEKPKVAKSLYVSALGDASISDIQVWIKLSLSLCLTSAIKMFSFPTSWNIHAWFKPRFRLFYYITIYYYMKNMYVRKKNNTLKNKTNENIIKRNNNTSPPWRTTKSLLLLLWTWCCYLNATKGTFYFIY
jgi:hypothetical protein